MVGRLTSGTIVPVSGVQVVASSGMGVTLTYPPTVPLGPPQPPPRRWIQRPAIIAIAVGVVIVLVCGSCMLGVLVKNALSRDKSVANSSNDLSPATVELSAAPTVQATTDTFAAAPEPTARPSTAPSAKIRVPNGVGLDYQSAQDLWRGAGLHVAPAIDAAGAHRLPIIDSNWVVLSQDPPAGSLVDDDSFITATVKKYTDD